MGETNQNQKLREARTVRGWTQAGLAEKLNIDSKSIGRWERGVSFPTPYYRQKLSEIYQMSLEELGLTRVIVPSKENVEVSSDFNNSITSHIPEESRSNLKKEQLRVSKKNLIPSNKSSLLVHGSIIAILLVIILAAGMAYILLAAKIVPPEHPSSALCIGTDLSLSGSDAILGRDIENGITLAIAQHHVLESGYTLNTCNFDDTSSITWNADPTLGVQNVEQSIKNPNVLGIIGPMNSNVAEAEIPVAARASIPIISPSATAICLTLQQYCPNSEQIHPLDAPSTFFRLVANDQQQGFALANFFFKSLGLRTAFVVDNGEVYGQELAQTFTQALNQQYGVNVLGYDHISNTETLAQISQVAQKIAFQKPEAVFYGGFTANGGGLLEEQLVRAGFSGLLIGGDGILDHQFLSDAGPTTNKVYAISLAPDPSTLPSWFTTMYQVSYGTQPGLSSSLGYDAAMILINAIKSVIQTSPQVLHNDVKSVREAILNAILYPNQPYHGLTGVITFDNNGNNIGTNFITIYTVANEQWVYEQEYTIAISNYINSTK